MTTALSNNLNELDILLQDLSAARYSGHIERKETVTQSRVYSSQIQDENERTISPRPPDRIKSKPLAQFLDAPDPELELHAVERTRTEKTSQSMTDNGNDESKWEYMGFGIWENRDGSTSPNPTGYRNGSLGGENSFRRSPERQTGYQKYSYEEKTVVKERFNGFPTNNGYQEPAGYLSDRSNGYQEPVADFQNGAKNGYQEKTTSISGYQQETTSTNGYKERNSGYQVENASTATQELDELMTSLNDFKMADRQVDEPVIPPNLDTMLGNLQEDMDKQGVKTTQKGICGACKKPIVGQVITALGYTWHPEHFTCGNCNQELGTSNFFERDGKPFCEQCYHQMFAPRCAYCQGPILDKCISALDNTWHPECFLCAGCGSQLGEEGFHERGDSAYCKSCYFNQFAPKCGGCNTPITENYISSLNQQWHPNCFVCKECNTPFHDGAFFEHEGHPYCETHYHALRGSLCAGCHKPISGRCITAMFRKFHPEHFVCSFCLKQLNKGTFKEQGDKPYCHECFDRLFG